MAVLNQGTLDSINKFINGETTITQFLSSLALGDIRSIGLVIDPENKLEKQSTMTMEEAKREIALLFTDLVLNHTNLGASLSSFPPCTDLQSTIDFFEKSVPGLRNIELVRRPTGVPQMGGTLDGTDTELETQLKAFENVIAEGYMMAEEQVSTTGRDEEDRQVVDIEILEID